jgi:hypothetical protein
VTASRWRSFIDTLLRRQAWLASAHQRRNVILQRSTGTCDNRHVIGVLWALVQQTGPMTAQQLLADPELHLQREPDSAGDNSADGTELIGNGPVSSVRVDSSGDRISIRLNTDDTCIAANAVMAQTGVKPGTHFFPMIDGGGGGSSPEFRYDAPDGMHFLGLSPGCSEYVEIYRYKGMHMPKRPGT